jgi:hypothetical protein
MLNYYLIETVAIWPKYFRSLAAMPEEFREQSSFPTTNSSDKTTEEMTTSSLSSGQYFVTLV